MVRWAVELTREESKRDYDAMAKLIKEYEKPAGDKESGSAINWALDRIQTISSTINSAESKLNSVRDSVKFRMNLVS